MNPTQSENNPQQTTDAERTTSPSTAHGNPGTGTTCSGNFASDSSNPGVPKSVMNRIIQAGPDVPLADPVQIDCYQNLERIGEGGMGIVYSCDDPKFPRKLALKLMKWNRDNNDLQRERFLAEARITATLQHAGIPPVHDIGQLDDGRPYYVMKLIQGSTLATIFKFQKEKLPWLNLLPIFQKVCETVAYAHKRGIINRDLKPQNIMVDNFGVVQVIDWGLSKKVDREPDAENSTRAGGQAAVAGIAPTVDLHLTEVGSKLGTPAYMPPEQADGRVHQLDERCDVFTLGAILFHLLTGVPPYQGATTAEVLAKAVRCDPGPIHHHLENSKAPTILIDLAKNCLAREREQRLSDAAAVAQIVKDYLQDVQRRLDQAEIEAASERQLRLAEQRTRVEAEAREAAETRSRRDAVARERAQRRGKRWAYAATAATLLLASGVLIFLLQRSARDQSLRDQAETLLREGVDILPARPDVARERALAAQTLVGDRSSFVDVKRRAEQLSTHATEMVQLHKDLETGATLFLQELEEAEFHVLGGLWAALPHEDPKGKQRVRRGARSGARLETGIELAERAMQRFGLPENSGALSELAQRGLEQPTVAQLHARAAEGTFLLALAIERANQGTAADKLTTARKRAIQLLDASERLGNRSNSLYLARARIHQALGNTDAAKQDNATAASLTPTTFLDHHMIAVEKDRSSKWLEAEAGYQKCLALRPKDYWTLFRFAKIKERQGLLPEAVGLYQSSISIRPKEPAGYNDRSLILHRMGKLDEAQAGLRRAMDVDSDFYPAVHNLLLVLADQKEVVEAQKVRDTFRRGRNLSAAEEAELLDDIGVAYERRGEFVNAYQQYTLALNEDPNFIQALRNRGNLAIQFGRFDDGEKDLKRAIELAPRNGELVYVLGNLYAAARQTEDAIGAYQQALKIDPNLADALYNQGVLLRRVKRFREAIVAQNALIVLKPKPETLRLALYERALSQANLKDFRSALEDLNQVIAQDPVNVSALIARGQVRGDLENDLIGSEGDISLAIHLAPNQADAYQPRGLTRFKLEKWQGAIDDFRQYLKLKPEAPDAEAIYNAISTSYLHLGKLDEAVKEFENIKEPLNANSLGNRGNLALMRGKLDEAIADFTRAIARDKGHVRAWALRGQARIRLGQFDEAAKDLDKALELNPGVYETLLFGGLAHFHRNDAKAARACLEIIVNERPNHMRGHMARGILHLLNQEHAAAITDLTAGVDDPVILRSFALLLRARAWIGVGGPGLKLALADADAYRLALPTDAYAQREAARICAIVVFRLSHAVGLIGG